jgi:signal transduction histidine kinase
MLTSLADSVRIQQSEGRYAAGIELAVDIPAEHVIGDWDPLRLEQVFLNLLDNALKYSSPNGPVSLSMKLEDDVAVVSVEDEGLGIPPDQLGQIFEPLSRGSNVLQGGFPGFGMGLAVCREIVERHGGSIAAQSKGSGRGARFTVRLPGVRRLGA